MRFQGFLKLLFWRKSESDLNDEMRFHLEKEIEAGVARGLSAPEARRQALIAFGGVQQTREQVREVRWTHFLDVFVQDLRYGLRMLRKSPAFTAVTALTLAFGIGGNSAIFSLIDAVLFRALPASHAEQLVLLRWHAHKQPGIRNLMGYGDCPQQTRGEHANGCVFSWPFLNLLRSQNSMFSGLAPFRATPVLDVSDNGTISLVKFGQHVSGEYFGTLGVRAELGRMIGPSDDSPGAAPVVVLSYGYWQSAFGGSPGALGRTIRLNGQPFTIVGVAQRKFDGLTPGRTIELWVPMSARPILNSRWTPADDDARSWWVVIVARLKPGVSPRQAQTALTLLFANQNLNEQKPVFRSVDAPGIDVVPAQQGLEGNRAVILEPLYLLMMAVGLVLLIACANIAGLLLARAASRNKEIAIRLTVGARRGRLVSQLMVEGALLAALGGTLGLFAGRWSAQALLLLFDRGSGPPPFTPQLDIRVLGFTTAIAVLTAVIFGLAPALRSLRVELNPALKAGGGATDAGAGRSGWYSLGNALVVAQVSLAIVVLVSAGLLVRTLSNLKGAELGFDERNLMTFSFGSYVAGYETAQMNAAFRDLQEQIAALPGVTSATYSTLTPLSGGSYIDSFHAPGTPDHQTTYVSALQVGPRFFESMRIPLKAGRDFSASDFDAAAAKMALLWKSPSGSNAAPTAAPFISVIVNEAFARRYFPDINPVGQRLDRPGWEIIGVAGDARFVSLRGDIEPTVYEASGTNAYFSVRTAGNPLAVVSAIRNVIHRKNSNLAMHEVVTEEEQIGRQLFTERLVARLSSFFGLLALLLACSGIYGLLSYEVARRTREIGIRMAIGAQPGDVIGLVVRHGMLVALAGAVIGSGASFAVRGLLKSILYRVHVGDPATLAAVTTILLAIALCACFVPARRATRVDPLDALRYE